MHMHFDLQVHENLHEHLHASLIIRMLLQHNYVVPFKDNHRRKKRKLFSSEIALIIDAIPRCLGVSNTFSIIKKCQEQLQAPAALTRDPPTQPLEPSPVPRDLGSQGHSCCYPVCRFSQW